MFAVVWFKDGKFLDGRTVHEPGPVEAEMPADARMYILPGETSAMRAQQPLAAVTECMKLLREARKEGW